MYIFENQSKGSHSALLLAIYGISVLSFNDSLIESGNLLVAPWRVVAIAV